MSPFLSAALPCSSSAKLPDAKLSSAKILLVDDDPDILQLYELILYAEGYTNIKSTVDPQGVLSLFIEYDPDIVILDLMMPHLDGLQLVEILQKAARNGKTLPILVITALSSREERRTALSVGAIDVMQKPFDPQELALRIRNLLKLHLELQDVERQKHALSTELRDRTEELSYYRLELKESQLEIIARLARAGEQRDDETGQHTQRVAITSGLTAQSLGLSSEEATLIQKAAPLHDVGKIGVPDSILLKCGRLTETECGVMRQHCYLGAELLAGGRSEIVQKAGHIALSHHEKWDGSGYPCGIAGENIPIEGRIVAVADVFDALTHQRPYKPAWPVPQALQEIGFQAGRHFDPQVVASFQQLPHYDLI